MSKFQYLWGMSIRTSASSKSHGNSISERDDNSVVNYTSKLARDSVRITFTLAVDAAGM